MAEYFGQDIPKLGFGLMRLPKKVIGTDIEQTKLMVDRFMNAGFTYVKSCTNGGQPFLYEKFQTSQ